MEGQTYQYFIFLSFIDVYSHYHHVITVSFTLLVRGTFLARSYCKPLISDATHVSISSVKEHPLCCRDLLSIRVAPHFKLFHMAPCTLRLTPLAS